MTEVQSETGVLAGDERMLIDGEVSSGDVDRALDVAKRMRTGNVTINGKSHFGISSPFGGTKQGGLGSRNGEEGFREYLDIKTIGLPA